MLYVFSVHCVDVNVLLSVLYDTIIVYTTCIYRIQVSNTHFYIRTWIAKGKCIYWNLFTRLGSVQVSC